MDIYNKRQEIRHSPPVDLVTSQSLQIAFFMAQRHRYQVPIAKVDLEGVFRLRFRLSPPPNDHKLEFHMTAKTCAYTKVQV